MNNSLLSQAYCDLEYDQGDLISLGNYDLSLIRKLDIGEWITSCERINKKSANFTIESLFFVKDNPAIVFGVCNSLNAKDIEQAYINIWNLSRTQYFFLEANGELLVYNFSAQFSLDNGKRNIPKPIEVVKVANEIKQKLQGLARNKIEAGIAQLSTNVKQSRADKTLINDVKKIRIELMKLGLKNENLQYAHSIIGRSIFIRYLEDRGILSYEYFSELASQKFEWTEILRRPLEGYVLETEGANVSYLKCLRDKEFTYALYHKLSQNFNGDMFPIDEKEETVVTGEHLQMICNFLQGKFDEQMRLFFWAYRFDVIPMELMSSLYEEFYHKQTETDNNGTHYTPLSLVEFVIKQALPVEVLETNPNILDPCCGSGIFLVEAFKRIVRFNIIKNKGLFLDYDQLKNILKTQIRGIELTEEALRVTAFSLYVAFLDFQEPPCILEQIKKGKYLPNLKCGNEIALSFDILLNGDAFSEDAMSFIDASKADVVIGNPPWGKADSKATEWCEKNGLPLGDKEYSQAFIWRAISFTKQNGRVCLLVPTGILSKTSSTSQLFRNKLIEKITVKEIVNFAHSRSLFFENAIAPFISFVFVNVPPNDNSYVSYWSVKGTSQNIQQQYIVLENADMHFIKQAQLIECPYAWKALWWGGVFDLYLLAKIKVNAPISAISEVGIISGQGFKPKKCGTSNGKTRSIDLLSKFKCLSLDNLVSYGDICKYLVNNPPKELHTNFNKFDLFEGNRIIVRRGIVDKGIIVARFEKASFSFTSGTNCIKLRNENELLSKSICAILLSSVARYYFFLTCSGWGMWHDEIHLDELEQFPIPNITENEHTQKLCSLMDEIKAYEDVTLDATTNISQRNFEDIMQEIDDVVFEMYKLTDDEQLFVKDMCNYGLDLFYNKANSIAVKELPAILNELIGNEASLPNDCHMIYDYIEKNVSVINKYLINIDAELEWRIYRSKGMIAVLLLTKYLSDPIGIDYEGKDEWEVALHEYSVLSKQPITDDIYIEGSFIGVSESCIVIIKKDEHRNWCSSAAVKDLNSVLLKLIDNQSTEVGANE